MPNKDYQKTEDEAGQQQASQTQTGQQGQQPVAAGQAPDMNQVLATLNQVFTTFQSQLQNQAPKPFEEDAAKKAVEKFNDILAGLQLKYVPDVPINFTAKPFSPNQINLSWTEPTNNPDGFKLERGEGTSPINFTEIKRFGLKEANYSDTKLTGKTTYTYRLRAFNLRGDSPLAEARATTL